MSICLIGNNLTNLVLANILINRKIKVDLYSTLQKKKISKDRIKVMIDNGMDNSEMVLEKLMEKLIQARRWRSVSKSHRCWRFHQNHK